MPACQRPWAANDETTRERDWFWFARYEKRRRRRPLLFMGDTVLTRQTQSMVSVPLVVRGFALAALLVVAACAGRQQPVVQTERAESNTGDLESERQAAVLQFDNQGTVYVDLYLVGAQIQWRLGRVPPGMRQTLNVPESAIDWTTGFVQLVVIPGSQASPEAWRDPRAIVAIRQPVSEVLAQRWTFRQGAGAGLQLQATRLAGRQ